MQLFRSIFYSFFLCGKKRVRSVIGNVEYSFSLIGLGQALPRVEMMPSEMDFGTSM